jgi:hypothetical protein
MFRKVAFNMQKNIKISFDLLNSAISLLECIDVEDYDHEFAQLFGYVSRSLIKKRHASDPCRPFAITDRDDGGYPYPCCSQCDAIPF